MRILTSKSSIRGLMRFQSVNRANVSLQNQDLACRSLVVNVHNFGTGLLHGLLSNTLSRDHQTLSKAESYSFINSD